MSKIQNKSAKPLSRANHITIDARRWSNSTSTKWWIASNLWFLHFHRSMRLSFTLKFSSILDNPNGMLSLLCIGNRHWVLGGDLEPLKSLHGNGSLHIIPKLYKGDAWLCFNHPDFPEARVLLEKDLQHHACRFMRQVLDEKDVVGSSSRLLRSCLSLAGGLTLHRF